ncbi:MAG: YdeI/OmpD-associated family protein [Euryarchaeota archaeon]|nr:YdeI/OmpD-associated family protein [Euryarchaeota archaeon]
MTSKARAVTVPTILKVALAKDSVAKTYFDGLPPSHRRAYVEYVTEAKQDETRARRTVKTVETLRKEAAKARK